MLKLDVRKIGKSLKKSETKTNIWSRPEGTISATICSDTFDGQAVNKRKRKKAVHWKMEVLQ